MADYVWRDGSRVAPGTLSAFNRMNADFQSATGCYLLISSGTRTNAEQAAIFRARYVTVGNVRGRRVYDTRRWNGVLWYRISAAGTVAVPGTSNHENDRALDIRDSGSNPGVTVAGTSRANWIKTNASRYGFRANGYGFGEPWHIEYTGNPWTVLAGGGSAPIPTPTPAAPAPPKRSNDMMMIHWTETTYIKAGKEGEYSAVSGPRYHYLVFGDSLIVDEFYADTYSGTQAKANGYAAQCNGSSVEVPKAEYDAIRARVVAGRGGGATSVSIGPELPAAVAEAVKALGPQLAAAVAEAVKALPSGPSAEEIAREFFRQSKLAGN